MQSMKRQARMLVWLAGGSILAAPAAAQPPATTGVVVVRAAGDTGAPGGPSAEAVGLGFVASTEHVVASVAADVTDFVVSGADGVEHEASLVAYDEAVGLGLLAIPGGLPAAYRFARDPAQAAQEVPRRDAERCRRRDTRARPGAGRAAGRRTARRVQRPGTQRGRTAAQQLRGDRWRRDRRFRGESGGGRQRTGGGRGVGARAFRRRRPGRQLRSRRRVRPTWRRPRRSNGPRRRPKPGREPRRRNWRRPKRSSRPRRRNWRWPKPRRGPRRRRPHASRPTPRRPRRRRSKPGSRPRRR